MNYYSSNIGGLTFGFYSILVFLIYFTVTIINGGSFGSLIPFIPTLRDTGILNFLGAVIISGLWGYFLGFTFFVTYNFYDRIFSK